MLMKLLKQNVDQLICNVNICKDHRKTQKLLSQ